MCYFGNPYALCCRSRKTLRKWIRNLAWFLHVFEPQPRNRYFTPCPPMLNPPTWTNHIFTVPGGQYSQDMFWILTTDPQFEVQSICLQFWRLDCAGGSRGGFPDFGVLLKRPFPFQVPRKPATKVMTATMRNLVRYTTIGLTAWIGGLLAERYKYSYCATPEVRWFCTLLWSTNADYTLGIEHLTRETVKFNPGIDRSRCEFFEDLSLHPFFRSTNRNYKGSGYDRGHLAAGNWINIIWIADYQRIL